MSNPLRWQSPGAAAIAFLVLAGCGAQLAPAGTRDFGSAATASPTKKGKAAYAYTCQGSPSLTDCLVYEAGKLVRKVTKDLTVPAGVVAGKSGTLYVADGGAKDILEFSAGAEKLTATISDGRNVPADVAVYGDELAVSNATTMTFFAKGAKSPTRTLKDSKAKKGTGAAFDTSENCYWAFVNTSSKAQVDEFKACTGSPHALTITAGAPYGIAFDGRNNLYYTSYESAANGVYVCSGTSSCTLTYKGFIAPQYLNFTSGFKDVWVDDTGNYQCYCTGLYEIDVSTGKTIGTITNGLSNFDPPTGVAAGPGSL